jgi:hypothetical protein
VSPKERIQAALDRSPGSYSIEDVSAEIAAGRCQLWPGRTSAVVTEVSKDFNIWLAGGTWDELKDMHQAGEAWAREQGCDTMTVTNARKGWARVLASLGYEEVTILRKRLDYG